jgi:hypothetical protein
MNYRRVAAFTGWLWLITFVTSIPARLFFYAPVLDHQGTYLTGAVAYVTARLVECTFIVKGYRTSSPALAGTQEAIA